MARKVKYAASVKIMTPHNGAKCASSSRKRRCKSDYTTQYVLDIGCKSGIITETFGKPILGDCSGRQERQQEPQSPGPARRGHVESCAWEGPGSEVPRWRILRSARHRAGQIRDAAPCIGGKCIGDQRDRGIRRIKADILPDQGQLRRSGDRWPSTQEAGATRSAQGTGCGARICPGAIGRGRAYSSAPNGRANPEEIQSRCSSKDDRASSGSKKNRALSADGRECREQLTDVVGQYEVLRNTALGHPLPPESRCGLTLFLRRGMWAWTRVMAVPPEGKLQDPGRRASLSFAAPDESRSIIHVFAAMAMNIELRGVTS